ncbi:MAG: hypothetical protein M3Y57_17160 [Acidobacteriota bacterium]|nr:hypothetical protein [Acidobacteriota bacterium]
MLSNFERTPEEGRTSLPSTENYALQQNSFRSSAALTIKLLLIGGGLFGLIWMLDTFLAS